ncbi:Zinc finger protein, partial [Pseudolycoriella hygida]
YYYAHQLEHKRVGLNINESEEVLLANFDACVDERIATNEHEFGQRSFSCLICNFTHDMHGDVRSHVRKLHIYKMFPRPLVPKKEFTCDLCGTRFTSKNGVRKHMEIHTNTRPYPCSICGKTFRLNSGRTIHERQHTGEKPFQCAECGKAFISQGLLTAHSKRHENTTYPCHICGKTFNLPSGYRNHVKTHRQDKPFKCTVCTKTFNTRLYLMRHLVIHSDKKYKCHFCDSEFNTGAGRRQHHRHKHKK